MNQFKFQLGDKLKDAVSGFQGIAVARIEYLNGCIQYAVKSNQLKDGLPQNAEYVDEGQLLLVKPYAVVIKKKPTGGPATIRTPKL